MTFKYKVILILACVNFVGCTKTQTSDSRSSGAAGEKNASDENQGRDGDAAELIGSFNAITRTPKVEVIPANIAQMTPGVGYRLLDDTDGLFMPDSKIPLIVNVIDMGKTLRVFVECNYLPSVSTCSKMKLSEVSIAYRVNPSEVTLKSFVQAQVANSFFKLFAPRESLQPLKLVAANGPYFKGYRTSYLPDNASNAAKGFYFDISDQLSGENVMVVVVSPDPSFKRYGAIKLMKSGLSDACNIPGATFDGCMESVIAALTPAQQANVVTYFNQCLTQVGSEAANFKGVFCRPVTTVDAATFELFGSLLIWHGIDQAMFYKLPRRAPRANIGVPSFLTKQNMKKFGRFVLNNSSNATPVLCILPTGARGEDIDRNCSVDSADERRALSKQGSINVCWQEGDVNSDQRVDEIDQNLIKIALGRKCDSGSPYPYPYPSYPYAYPSPNPYPYPRPVPK